MFKITIPYTDIVKQSQKHQNTIKNNVYIKRAPLTILPVLTALKNDLSVLYEHVKASKDNALIICTFNYDIHLSLDVKKDLEIGIKRNDG